MSDSARAFDFIVTQDVQQLAAATAGAASQGLSRTDARTNAEEYERAVLVPMSGEAFQKFGSRGLEPDGFTRQRAAFRFGARQDLRVATMVGFIPEGFGGAVDVRVACNASSISTTCEAGAIFTCALPVAIERGSEHDFEIELSRTYRPSAVIEGNRDGRDLGCVIVSVDFR